MKLTKLDLIKLWNSIDACKEFKNTKFIYATLKTKKLIETQVDLLQELARPSKKYQEFQKERIKLCQRLAKKTQDGSFVIEHGEYSFDPGIKEQFDQQLSDLKNKYQSYIDEREEQVVNYNSIIKEEVDVDIYTTDIRNIPQDLDASVLEGLMPIIQD